MVRPIGRGPSPDDSTRPHQMAERRAVTSPAGSPDLDGKQRLQAFGPEANLLDRWAGSLLGTLTGEALGLPLEGVSAQKIAARFGPAERLIPPGFGAGGYGDGTQMMIAVAESLVACGACDPPDMAGRLVRHWDPRRGYGWGTSQVLERLKRGLPWQQAAEGVLPGGSYGIGAALRVAPVGIFYAEEPVALVRAAADSAAVTHIHPLGIQGSIWQAGAVAAAFTWPRSRPFAAGPFLSRLEGLYPWGETYRKKLGAVRRLLPGPVPPEVVNLILGNGVEAHNAVPAALYCFLAQSEDFAAAVSYAVALGGATNTLAALCGAIAGAYHGVQAIPQVWWGRLENGPRGRDHVLALALQLARAGGLPVTDP